MSMAEKSNSRKIKRFLHTWETDYFFALNANAQPQCLVCNKIVVCVRSSNFARHYNNFHKTLYDELSKDDRLQIVKDLKLKWQTNSLTIDSQIPTIQVQTLAGVKLEWEPESPTVDGSFSSPCYTVQEQSLAGSYEVALDLARSNLSFTHGEIIKRCAIKMARSCNNDAAVSSFQAMPMSHQTIASRVRCISSQIQGNLKTLLSSCRYFSLCLNESTDVSDVTELLIFARIIQDDFTVNEELLNLTSLHGSTTGRDIFNAVNAHVSEFVGNFDKCSAIVTDGALAMIGNKLGFKGILKENGVQCSVFHCIIHQENLCGKMLNLSSTMKIVTKIVNMIRSGYEAFSHRKFQSFLKDVNAAYSHISLDSEIRWLSAGKTLQSFFALRKHIPEFLEQNVENSEGMQALFKSTIFLKDLAFLTDVTEHLNTLNLKLQARDQKVSELVSHIGAYRNRFALFTSQMSKNELCHFPSCVSLKQDLSDSDADFSTFAYTLQSILDEFEAYFKDFNSLKTDLDIFNNPLTISSLSQDVAYQIELCDLQNDQSFVNRTESGLDFFKLLPEYKYPMLRDLGLKICSMFGSTYMCKSAFSVMKYVKSVKSTQRAQLTDSTLTHLMRISSSTIPVNIPDLVRKASRPQCSH